MECKFLLHRIIIQQRRNINIYWCLLHNLSACNDLFMTPPLTLQTRTCAVKKKKSFQQRAAPRGSPKTGRNKRKRSWTGQNCWAAPICEARECVPFLGGVIEKVHPLFNSLSGLRRMTTRNGTPVHCLLVHGGILHTFFLDSVRVTLNHLFFHWLTIEGLGVFLVVCDRMRKVVPYLCLNTLVCVYLHVNNCLCIFLPFPTIWNLVSSLIHLQSMLLSCWIW